MDQRPIGVFDSGLGGVSTLIQARKALPAETYVYFGDSANAPYGVRSGEELQELGLRAGEFLVAQGVKAILMACNSTTAAAYDTIAAALPVPVIGIQPAVREAICGTEGGLVLLMATEATVRLGGAQKLLLGTPGAGRLREVPCPGEMVRRIENGVFAPGSYDDLLESLLSPFRGEQVGAIVLGCTHYPFIQAEIARYAVAHFRGTPCFFEGGKAAVAALQATLREKELTNADGNASVAFHTSGDEGIMRPRFEALLQRTLA